MAIKLTITHSIQETDFGPYHSWSSSAAHTAHNDEATIRKMTDEVAGKLRAAGIDVEIEEITRRNPYPKEW